MGLHDLRAPKGARRPKRRRGLGDSAGQGSYSGRGFKGQLKRGSVRPLFEGGQNKLVKRLPYMRGFNNLFRTAYAPVNLERLKGFGPDAEITPQVLLERGVVNDAGAPIKILGEGDAPSGLKVSAHAISASARAKIESAGGTVTLLVAPKEPVESSHLPDRARRARAQSAAARERAGSSARAQDQSQAPATAAGAEARGAAGAKAPRRPRAERAEGSMGDAQSQSKDA